MKRAVRGSAALHWTPTTPRMREHLLLRLLAPARFFIVREPHFDHQGIHNLALRLILEEP